MLIDSNIIIYAAKPEHGNLRRFIAENAPVVSAVSYVEVLGVHQLVEQEKMLLQAFFAATVILPVTQAVLDQTVVLRQQRRMSLGDALVASTALVYNYAVVTHNTKDFTWIDSLTVFDPLADENNSTS